MKKWLRIMAMVIIGLVATISTGCKGNQYDITGEWRVDFTLGSAGYFEVAFAGNRTTGIVIWSNQAAGEYDVADRDVQFVLRITLISSGVTRTFIYHFVGSFDSQNQMSGNVKAYDPQVQGSEVNGSWSAEKI